VTHDIPAKSKLVPTVPITSREFVYRRAGDTDVRLTFARAREREVADALGASRAGRPDRRGVYVLAAPRVAGRSGR